MNTEAERSYFFGRFRLDGEKRILWCDDAPVQIPSKSIELLCLLVENHGEVTTKSQIWQSIWPDTFVEETNLTHNIYLLRKTFKDLGEKDLIQTVPRRGYRFTGAVSVTGRSFVMERRTQTRTTIEMVDGRDSANAPERSGSVRRSMFFSRVTAVTVIALLGVLAFVGYRAWQASYSGPEIRSIAVLPFKDLTGNDDDRRGLGLADILITRLSNIRELNIRPTQAVIGLENEMTDSVEAVRALNVDAVLEGTIFTSNESVRINARLLRVSDGSPIWAGTFEKPIQDEMRLQDELALQLVDALAFSMSGQERRALTKRFTESADAYQLYTKGRYEWNKRSTAGMIEAQRLFRNAIEKDPKFALAYSGLADTVAMNSQDETAFRAVEKALELDPKLAEAHATKGFLLLFRQWNWDGAEDAFKHSIDLNPGYATSHHWYATLLAIKGRNEEAKGEMRLALEIDPLSYNFLADLGQIHYFAGQYDIAEQYCLRALEIYPEFSFAHEYLHYIYIKTGEHKKALEHIIASDTRYSVTLAEPDDKLNARLKKMFDGYRYAFDKNGISGYLEHRFPGETVQGDAFYLYAAKNALLGETDKALDYLEKAKSERPFLMAFVKADPRFETLRADQRFGNILRGMNLGD